MEYTYNEGATLKTNTGEEVLIPDQVLENMEAFESKIFEVINQECDSVEAMFDFDRKELVLF